jgi:hypothetical protein
LNRCEWRILKGRGAQANRTVNQECSRRVRAPCTTLSALSVHALCVGGERFPKRRLARGQVAK